MFGTWGAILSGGTIYAGTTGYLLAMEALSLFFSVDDMSTAFYEEHGSFLENELGIDKDDLSKLKTATSATNFVIGMRGLIQNALKNPNTSTDVIDAAGTILNELNTIEGIKNETKE